MITMSKGTHVSGQSMCGQLIDLLDKDEILKFSRAHHGERYVKHFDAYLTVVPYTTIYCCPVNIFCSSKMFTGQQ